MATEPMPALLSYADYAAIGDDRPAQVVDGVLVMTPSPVPDHQRIAFRIGRALVDYAAARGGEAFALPIDVVLRAERPAQIVQPDAMYFSPERRGRIGRKHATGAPDVVLEVLSPSNARLDGVRKRALYEEHGVREYWMVPLHADRIEVLALGPDGRYARPVVFESGDVLTSEAMPGLSLDVAAVFAGLDEADAQDA